MLVRVLNTPVCSALTLGGSPEKTEELTKEKLMVARNTATILH